MSRSISHSEVAALLECTQRHAFAYTGALTDGDALKPKAEAAPLRDGRAWGLAVAAWHQTGNDNKARLMLASSLREDAAHQQALGLYLPEQHEETERRLTGVLEHYIATADRIPIGRLEHELDVPIPSRTGRRRSSVYRLKAYLDGIHVDDDSRAWIYEAKLRGQLMPLEQIALSRQTRWYAWGYEQTYGQEVAGVIVDERLNTPPSPVKLNQNGTPSKVQSCTLDAYIAAWEELGWEPDEETVAKLTAKDWQRRSTVVFRRDEIDEAGRQLVTAARLVHGHDTGLLTPIRNPSRAKCPGCPYRQICADPSDVDLVDALFERRPPKRLREQEEMLTHA